MQINKEDTVVKVNDISKIFYTKNKTKKAIDKITFELKRGEVLGYIGKNGAGKSTMIKILCGILTPTSGEAKVSQIVPYKKRMENAKNIGVVFGQRTQLWWDLPLIDSFNLLKKVYRISDEKYKKRLDYFDEVFDISKYYDSLVRTLSLGERMKADIVASMLHNPKVLFLDEPTIGLDFRSKRKMREVILDINKKYKTSIILTTHDLRDIEELCKKIIIIDNGKKIYDDSMNSLRKIYGNYKLIEADLVSKSFFTDLEKNLSKLGFETKLLKNQQKVTIMFEEQKENISKLMEIIFSKNYLKNITIKDNSLENIIEKIYEENN